MMREKKRRAFVLPILIGIFVLALAGSVSALVRDQQMLFPNSSQTITSAGGILVTLQTEVNGSMYANYGNAITGVNVSNVSWTITGISGRACVNSSNVNNNTLSTWKCEVEVTSIPDITLVTVQATVWNGTSASDSGFTARNTTSSTSVRIDNTIPVIAHDIVANTEFTKTSALLTATIQNSTGNCQFRFGSNIHLGTLSGTTCSYTLSAGKPADGIYSVTVVADDGLNSTTSAGRDFNVDFSNPASIGGVGTAKIAEVAVQKKASDNKTFLFILIAAAAAVMIGRKKG